MAAYDVHVQEQCMSRFWTNYQLTHFSFDAFMNALHALIAIRGPVSQLRSDIRAGEMQRSMTATLNQRKLAKVTEVYPDTDGCVRSFKLLISASE